MLTMFFALIGPTSADTGPNYVGGADVTTDDVRAIFDPLIDSLGVDLSVVSYYF